MASQKREDPKKTSEKPADQKELSTSELDKVSGGLQRQKTADPDEGGE